MDFEPMRLFLESGKFMFHTTSYMPMNVFFRMFTEFCAERGYLAPRLKYADIWKRYNIHCAKRSLVWEDRKLSTRFLMGIEPDYLLRSE